MKKLLATLLTALLCVSLILPAPVARAEQGSVTIYSMLLFLIQSYQVQPTAAYDVTDMLTNPDNPAPTETVIGFLLERNWLLLAGVNGAGEFSATVFAYADDSFFVLLQAIAGTYESLQQTTTRPGETLVIELTISDGQTYVFDSAEDAQALVEMLSE